MSKEDIDFNKLGTPKNMDAKVQGIDTEEAVALIHDEQTATEKTKRVTIDLPFSLYVDIKTKIVAEEKTMKDYFIELAKRNLNT